MTTNENKFIINFLFYCIFYLIYSPMSKNTNGYTGNMNISFFSGITEKNPIYPHINVIITIKLFLSPLFSAIYYLIASPIITMVKFNVNGRAFSI
jgi:hypothetical protein